MLIFLTKVTFRVKNTPENKNTVSFENTFEQKLKGQLSPKLLKI